MPAHVYDQVVKMGEVESSHPAPYIDFLSTQDGIGFEPDLEHQYERLPFGVLESTPAGLTATQAEPSTTSWIPGRMWAIPGPYTGLGPHGYRRSDGRILDDVCERLTRHGLLDASEIEVGVDAGVVTLCGAVAGRAESEMAAATAEGVPGVIATVNRLRLKG